jgi:aspartyl-tRNA synthetase
MLTSLREPIVEACKFRLRGVPKTVQKFIRDFMDSPEAEPFRKNDDGAPGIFVYDSRMPLEGLQAFGFEGAESLKAMYAEIPKSLPEDHSPSATETATIESAETLETPGTASTLNTPQDQVADAEENGAFEDGDLLIVQARENATHSSGSTVLGRLRLAIYKDAVSKGLLEQDPLQHYLWVTHFPLFTLDNSSDSGQGGNAGFSATHHPFTAPKTVADVDLLLTDPLKAKADHYDLVVNGVELGGGSRRIHNSEMQQFIMRDILKVCSITSFHS